MAATTLKPISSFILFGPSFKAMLRSKKSFQIPLERGKVCVEILTWYFYVRSSKNLMTLLYLLAKTSKLKTYLHLSSGLQLTFFSLLLIIAN